MNEKIIALNNLFVKLLLLGYNETIADDYVMFLTKLENSDKCLEFCIDNWLFKYRNRFTELYDVSILDILEMKHLTGGSK